MLFTEEGTLNCVNAMPSKALSPIALYVPSMVRSVSAVQPAKALSPITGAISQISSYVAGILSVALLSELRSCRKESGTYAISSTVTDSSVFGTATEFSAI